VSGARWQRLQELFEGLLERAPGEREAWLASVEPDPDLRGEALALVDADSGPRVSITRQVREASARVAEANGVERRLGPYKLIEEIGSGGMGTVFLAERADDAFARRVAIKVLRGIPTRESTERMRRERQILADLSHPHIARLLDGGSTADGQPYLVMEYVEGEPINQFCEKRALAVADRLRLIQKVCGAVQFAHQRLVIHRDLKPANVLVRADGEPVLLDFGIAKLLGNTGGDAATGMPWFTPAYASPEQRRGEAVSTATDVHGLGLLLYEVLAERPPSADASERLPKPSQATARHRIPAELDLIVAKATHAEPERRYVSAAALADDLQRYLRGRPVNAAPDRLHYRIAKFVGRHRLATAAIAAAFVMAILFTWRLANERDRALRAEAEARQQSATAERVVDYLVSLFHSASPEEAGTKPIAPRELVDRGRKEIDTRLAGSPVQQARLLGAIGKIYLELGAPEAAAESLGSAAELERGHGTPARRAAYLADQGYAFNIAEQPASAEPVLRESVAELEKAPQQEPKAMADALSTLALAEARNGNPQAALGTLQRALDYAHQADGGEEGIRVGQSLYALAEVEMRLGKLDDAEKNARHSIELLRAKTPEGSPEVISAIGFLTEVYEQQGRYAEGEALLRQMLAVRLKTLAPDSAWAITVRNNLAQAIQLQGRIVEATSLLRQNVDYLRAADQRDTASYFISLNNLASLLEQAGDYASSIELFDETLKRAEQHESDPHMATYRQNLGRSLMLAGKLDTAWPYLDRDIEGGTDSLDLNIERGRRLVHLAEWMRRSGRLDEAMSYADLAGAQFAALYPADHPRQGAVARTRALVLRDQGRTAEAEIEMRRAVKILAAGIGKDANATLETELLLAQLLASRGRSEEAQALMAHIGPLLEARFVETAPARRDFGDLQRKLDAS
jgi:serine/threonine-protein kinase